MLDLSNGKLYIKKRTMPEWLTCYIIILPFFLAFLQEFLGLPGIIKYTIDIVWVTVLCLLFLQKRVFLDRKIAPFIIIMATWFVYTLVVYLFNFQSPFYYLWGVRNNFRFYVAFIAFIVLFDEDDADSFLRFVDRLFWVNAGVSLVQFFILGYDQDYLGGIFGVERGCNAYSIIFFGLVLSKSILSFLNKKESAWLCMAKCATALIISAMAELKFFFVVFLFIFFMATMLTRVSLRNVLLMLVAAILLVFSSSVLTMFFGDSSNLSFERIMELVTATNYATAEDLGRFTAIPTISETFLTSFPKKLVGLGLGNCETSSFAICNTPFYAMHADLHYTWFSSAFLFLETGYIGLVLNVLFFITCFLRARAHRKNGGGNELFCQISMIFSVLCIILTFYNSSLRMEVGYIAYFALALHAISSKTSRA